MDQYLITLEARKRGFHLITDEIVRQLTELHSYRLGLAHIHILHTSASLTINENADPVVRADMERWFNEVVPEDAPYYRHVDEGADDMPAHIKASMLGSSVVIPVRQGRLLLGTWQGIYLGEHRNGGGCRRIVVTIDGEKEHPAII
jgi:secondary thiamine-phosphate synthase enzyme